MQQIKNIEHVERFLGFQLFKLNRNMANFDILKG